MKPQTDRLYNKPEEVFEHPPHLVEGTSKGGGSLLSSVMQDLLKAMVALNRKHQQLFIIPLYRGACFINQTIKVSSITRTRRITW